MKWSLSPSARIQGALLWVTIASAATTLAGCEEFLPGEETGEVMDGAFPYDAEPGTCDGWKVRYCEAAVQCGRITLEECELDAGLVVCHADAPFVECEKKFNKVINKEDCSLYPLACEPRDVADRSEAIEVCRQVQRAHCEYVFFCEGYPDTETCVATTNNQYECDRALSIGTGSATCADEIASMSCGDALPESCYDHTRY